MKNNNTTQNNTMQDAVQKNQAQPKSSFDLVKLKSPNIVNVNIFDAVP